MSVLCIYVNASGFLSGLIFAFFIIKMILNLMTFCQWECSTEKKVYELVPCSSAFCLLCLLKHKDIFRMGILYQCRFVQYTLEWEMKNDCCLVLMHSIRKVLVMVITLNAATSNFSLNPRAINFSFSLELHL